MLKSNFGYLLQNSQISFLASCKIELVQFYRIVFTSSSGRYETIVSVLSKNNENSYIPNIVRWQKLEDGYVGFSVQDF